MVVGWFSGSEDSSRARELQLSKAQAACHTLTDETPHQQAGLAGSEVENPALQPSRKSTWEGANTGAVGLVSRTVLRDGLF